MDEYGELYHNLVIPYDFDLKEQSLIFDKYTHYSLPWQGDLIPYEQGSFHIQIRSHVDQSTASWYSGSLIEIGPYELDYMPEGPARMVITRNYSEPIDEGTQAGGRSDVSVVREYEIYIANPYYRSSEKDK